MLKLSATWCLRVSVNDNVATHDATPNAIAHIFSRERTGRPDSDATVSRAASTNDRRELSTGKAFSLTDENPIW